VLPTNFLCFFSLSGILATLPHLPRHLLCVFCLASSNIQGIYQFLSLAWQRYTKPPMDVTYYAPVQHVQSIKELEVRSFGHSVVPADNKLSSAQKAAAKWAFVDYAVVWKAWIDGS
jgi:hypothetical protein